MIKNMIIFRGVAQFGRALEYNTQPYKMVINIIKKVKLIAS